NFERLLFELAGRESRRLVEQMTSLREKGRFELTAGESGEMRRLFAAARTDEDATIAEIRRLHDETGYVADPHTAVGTAAARRVPRETSVPMITLATAHPAKFPDAIERALGRKPAVPDVVARQAALPERIDRLPGDAASIAAFIEARCGARRI
ncbi:MAG: threonine synthase, partial [Hyphomicrobiaceae bacterium]